MFFFHFAMSPSWFCQGFGAKCSANIIYVLNHFASLTFSRISLVWIVLLFVWRFAMLSCVKIFEYLHRHLGCRPKVRSCWLPDSQLRLFHGGRESQNSNNAKLHLKAWDAGHTHTHTNIQTFVTVWNRYPPRTKYLTISKAWSIMRTCDLFWLLMRANQKTDAWFGAGDSCCLVLHTSPEMQLEYVWMLLICACWFWWQWLKAVVHHHFWAQGDSGELGVSSTFTMLLHVPSCLNGFQQNIRSNYSNFSHSHGPRGNHMTSVLCTASYCDAKLEVEHYSASEHRVTTSEFRW